MLIEKLDDLRYSGVEGDNDANLFVLDFGDDLFHCAVLSFNFMLFVVDVILVRVGGHVFFECIFEDGDDHWLNVLSGEHVMRCLFESFEERHGGSMEEL